MPVRQPSGPQPFQPPTPPVSGSGQQVECYPTGTDPFGNPMHQCALSVIGATPVPGTPSPGPVIDPPRLPTAQNPTTTQSGPSTLEVIVREKILLSDDEQFRGNLAVPSDASGSNWVTLGQPELQAFKTIAPVDAGAFVNDVTFWNFGLRLPPNATITGIEIQMKRNCFSGSISEERIRLLTCGFSYGAIDTLMLRFVDGDYHLSSDGVSWSEVTPTFDPGAAYDGYTLRTLNGQFMVQAFIDSTAFDYYFSSDGLSFTRSAELGNIFREPRVHLPLEGGSYVYLDFDGVLLALDEDFEETSNESMDANNPSLIQLESGRVLAAGGHETSAVTPRGRDYYYSDNDGASWTDAKELVSCGSYFDVEVLGVFKAAGTCYGFLTCQPTLEASFGRIVLATTEDGLSFTEILEVVDSFPGSGTLTMPVHIGPTSVYICASLPEEDMLDLYRVTGSSVDPLPAPAATTFGFRYLEGSNLFGRLVLNEASYDPEEDNYLIDLEVTQDFESFETMGTDLPRGSSTSFSALGSMNYEPLRFFAEAEIV